MRFFFFQAEDGIRDLTVTGVQTCALPISVRVARARHPAPVRGRHDLAPRRTCPVGRGGRSEEHTSELQSQSNLVCRLLLEKKKELDVQPTARRSSSLAHHRIRLSWQPSSY